MKVPFKPGVVVKFEVGDIVRAPIGILIWDESKVDMAGFKRGRVAAISVGDQWRSATVHVFDVDDGRQHSFSVNTVILDVEWAFRMARSRHLKDVIRDRKKRRKREEREEQRAAR